MAWRSGSSMFVEFWPIIQKYMPERDERIDFTSDILRLLANGDMDTWDVEDIHEEIRVALVRAGIEITEPERYPDVPNGKKNPEDI